MDAENNKKGMSGNFGGVIDALHNKTKLPSLRTYQGDMAQFIKEKNESVISVATKEKIREEKREKEQTAIDTIPKPKIKTNNFQINFTKILLSLLLIAGGVVTLFYVLTSTKDRPIRTPVDTREIISPNQTVTLANIQKENLKQELIKLNQNGITLTKISDTNGNLINEVQKFFDLIEIPDNLTIHRTLKNEFTLGTIAQNNNLSPFLIITIDDFGRAFASMLEWEEGMANDLSFLINNQNTPNQDTTWRDLIVKNKDTRALVDKAGNTKIAYTFLDKNTILITGDISIIGEIDDLYRSRAVAR